MSPQLLINQLKELCLERHSIRAFSQEPVGDNLLKELLEVVRTAPSAFLTLPHTSGKRYRDRGEKLYSIQDATIACTYALLAISALGLSTTWVGAFDDEQVTFAFFPFDNHASSLTSLWI